jgi:hypothetical protein
MHCISTLTIQFYIVFIYEWCVKCVVSTFRQLTLMLTIATQTLPSQKNVGATCSSERLIVPRVICTSQAD